MDELSVLSYTLFYNFFKKFFILRCHEPIVAFGQYVFACFAAYFWIDGCAGELEYLFGKGVDIVAGDEVPAFFVFDDFM